MMPEENKVIKELNKAYGVLSDLCEGKIKFTMCIPVQKGDPDEVIGQAIISAKREIRRLEGLCELKEDGFQLLKTERDLLDNIREAAERISVVWNTGALSKWGSEIEAYKEAVKIWEDF